jgi:hypothetical protein
MGNGRNFGPLLLPDLEHLHHERDRVILPAQTTRDLREDRPVLYSSRQIGLRPAKQSAGCEDVRGAFSVSLLFRRMSSELNVRTPVRNRS